MSPSNQAMTDAPNHQSHIEHLNKNQDSITASNTSATEIIPKNLYLQRRFNVVVYGIEKSPPKTLTSRHLRS